MNVIKRNGQFEPFNSEKIYKAVMKAAIACGEENFTEEATAVAEDVSSLLSDIGNDIGVEEIQDLVEVSLYYMAENPTVTKAYILYREKRKQDREKAEKYTKIIRDRAIAPDEANQKQNANVDEESFSGRMYEASEALWKETALDDFMPKEIADLHREGELYEHDLSRWSIGESNCLTFDATKIFKDGLITRQSHLRPPSRFASACQQIAVIMQIISQCQYGGIAEPHIDRTLAPFIEKSRQRIKKRYPELSIESWEKMLEDEIKQGAEALIANLSSLQSRSGSQLPFSSLVFGADTSPDGLKVSEAILEAMIDGVGPHHITPPFPILCFQVKGGVNKYPGDPGYENYKLAIKCATMRLTPNFVNLDSSVCHSEENDPDTWLTAMGCRTQMGYDRFNSEHPYNRVGRGNLAPATIIPVAAAIRQGICLGEREKPDLEAFREEFEYLLKKAEEALLVRANLIFRQKMSSAYEMYVNHVWKADYEYDPEASTEVVLRHGSLTIGVVGWAEALIALFGKNQYESEEAADFLMEMTMRLNQFCKEASERNNLNFAAYATPELSVGAL